MKCRNPLAIVATKRPYGAMRHCEKEKGDSGRMDRDTSQDRRNFIRGFGATLGSLIVSGSLSGCGRRKDVRLSGTGNVVSSQDDPTTNVRRMSTPEWEELRQCWLSLKGLNSGNLEWTLEADRTVVDAEVRKRHKALIDRLVATGQVEEAVARQMETAFVGAFAHVVRSMATCYFVIPPEYGPREDLLEQADALRKVSGDVDPATVAKAEAALAQDIAFLDLFNGSNGGSLIGGYNAGALNVSPEALEAARLLTRLFSEKPD